MILRHNAVEERIFGTLHSFPVPFRPFRYLTEYKESSLISMDKIHQSTICSESSDISLSESQKIDEKSPLQDRVGTSPIQQIQTLNLEV